MYYLQISNNTKPMFFINHRKKRFFSKNFTVNLTLDNDGDKIISVQSKFFITRLL